jgi:hypothetical protein
MREMLPKMRDFRARLEDVPQVLRDEYGIYVNDVAPVQWQGRKVWAIGSRVYADRPPHETFHEFLLHVLRGTLGEEWRNREMAKPEDERHFVMKCFEQYDVFVEAMRTPENQQGEAQWAADANGFVVYLLSLAWDVASLIHAINLPDALVERLRDPVAFQGARYEIAVAAIFARLDCEIRFLDEDDELRGHKHVEFIATHRPSGQDIAVETKSRRRAGVLHEEGEHDPDDPLRGDPRAVRRRFMEALEQAPDDMPLMIFIDINAPLEPEADGLSKQWMQDIKRWQDRLPTPTAAEPDAYNALYVTNFAPHYDGENLSRGGEWLSIRPLYTRNALHFDLTGMLDHAIDKYQRVPEIAEGGEILR